MAVAPTDLIPVATRIEPALREQLTQKRKLADRSEAAEVRQAIRAWVEDEDRDPVEKAAA